MNHYTNATTLPDDRESPERTLWAAVIEQWAKDLHLRDAEAILCVRQLDTTADHRSGVSTMIDFIGMDPNTVLAGLRRLADDAAASSYILRMLQPAAHIACSGSATGQSVAVGQVFDEDVSRFRAHVVEARRVARERWPTARVTVAWGGQNDEGAP